MDTTSARTKRPDYAHINDADAWATYAEALVEENAALRGALAQVEARLRDTTAERRCEGRDHVWENDQLEDGKPCLCGVRVARRPSSLQREEWERAYGPVQPGRF